MSNLQLALHFLLQIALILAACQLVGLAARRLGQPQVVAEMITGVLLGPSLLGHVAPGFFAQLFPPDTLRVLFPVAQLGLAAYMFVVGLEFRLDLVRRRLRSAIAVSIAGMLAPLALGAALGWAFLQHTTLFPPGTSALQATLFLGAALSITAFPMLARIIHFKKLTGTTMGAVSLGAGALNDAGAWALLAIVLAAIDRAFVPAALNLAGGLAYVAGAIFVARPLLARWGRGIELRGRMSDAEFAACIVLLALGAWCTEAVGLHAVFGAFILGAVMPRGVMTSTLIDRIQPLTVALLLPIFFAYSGLNTRIDLLDSAYLWGMVALLLLASIVGKAVACWLAARATGISHREALGIGTLMNVRGLMGLVIIDIGLQRGILSPALFAALAIMAVITTVIASPLFDGLVGSYGRDEELQSAPARVR